MFVIILTSCSKEGDELINVDKFYPLSIGNKWTYEVYTSREGSISEEQVFTVKKDTSIIIQEESFNAFIVESYRTSEEDLKWNIFQGHDINGNIVQYGARVQSASIIDKSIQYKKNPETGDVWNFSHLVYNEEDGIIAEVNEMQCIQNDTIITTVAGTFSCIKYYDKFKRWEDSNEKHFYYVNPKIGLIKYSLISEGNILVETSLKEYLIIE